MELFKFTPVTSPTVLERGEIIKGAKSVMWVERYRETGEFEIVAELGSGLREFLPAGTLISHTDTFEVMIVESQEIEEQAGENPNIKISGRSFESFLENRIVGVDKVRASPIFTEYVLGATYTWNQAINLINDHIQSTVDPNDALTNVVGTHYIGGTGVSEARQLSRSNVLKHLQDILAVDDLGIMTLRSNTFGFGSSTDTWLWVYKGENRTNSVIFSWKAGDLDSAEYLLSDKRLKNSALVLGRYVNKMVDLGPTKYDRRMMVVSADDIDGHLSAPPTGSALTTILARMTTRGQQALKSQNRVMISRTDVSKTTKYQYRRDYNVGDLVSLDGNFGQIAVMRVVEYVEIEDENGESGHPTLAVPGE